MNDNPLSITQPFNPPYDYHWQAWKQHPENVDLIYGVLKRSIRDDPDGVDSRLYIVNTATGRMGWRWANRKDQEIYEVEITSEIEVADRNARLPEPPSHTLPLGLYFYADAWTAGELMQDETEAKRDHEDTESDHLHSQVVSYQSSGKKARNIVIVVVLALVAGLIYLITNTPSFTGSDLGNIMIGQQQTSTPTVTLIPLCDADHQFAEGVFEIEGEQRYMPVTFLGVPGSSYRTDFPAEMLATLQHEQTLELVAQYLGDALRQDAFEREDQVTYEKDWVTAIGRSLRAWRISLESGLHNACWTFPADADKLALVEVPSSAPVGQPIPVNGVPTNTIPTPTPFQPDERTLEEKVRDLCEEYGASDIDYCVEQVLNDPTLGDNPNEAVIASVVLNHFSAIRPTPVPPNPELAGLLAADGRVYPRVAWDPLMGRQNPEMEELWALAEGRLQVSIGVLGLCQAYAPNGKVVINIISDCGAAGIDAQNSAFSLSEATFRLGDQGQRFVPYGVDVVGIPTFSQKVKDVIVEPVYWYDRPMPAPTAHIQPAVVFPTPVATIVFGDGNGGVYITPTPVPTMVHPQCVAINFSEILNQSGSGYQLLVNRGELPWMHAINQVSQDANGVWRREWYGSAEASQQRNCYHIIGSGTYNVTQVFQYSEIIITVTGTWSADVNLPASGGTLCVETYTGACWTDGSTSDVFTYLGARINGKKVFVTPYTELSRTQTDR